MKIQRAKLKTTRCRAVGWIAGVFGVMCCINGSVLLAGDEAGKAVTAEVDVSDKAWSYADLWDRTVFYENEENAFIQKVTFIGRFHGQYHYVDSDRGHDDGWEERRIRPGFKFNFLNDFMFVMEANIRGADDIHEEYLKGWDNFYLDWKPTKDLKFRVGRQKSNTSRERFTSSRFVIPFNRSRLVLQSTVDKIMGASVFYNINEKVTVQTGIFSDLLDGKFQEFEGSGSANALLKLGYEMNDNTQFYLDYWWADPKADRGKETRPYAHVVSLNSLNEWDGYGLQTDLLYTSGAAERDGQSTWGLMFMPWYNITPKLRGVFRYQLASSNSDTGVALQSRYEARAVTDGGGKEGRVYNAFYAGLDYQFLDKDRLKLMIGSEYTNMSGGKDDFSGWTHFAGVRTWW